jgi:hypothetical protein
MIAGLARVVSRGGEAELRIETARGAGSSMVFGALAA